jgi:nucleotide-binding universal stress UspA family protein
VRELVTLGDVRDEILRVAAQTEADVIVMGTRGLGPLGRMLSGSTAQGVVRAARCPVLTLRSARQAPPTHVPAWLADAHVLPPPM